jgi:hypothetical protein
MNPPGASPRPNLLVQARSALLDALVALDEHRDAIIVIGSQAIYLQTVEIRMRVALAEATKDSDLAVDPDRLANEPLLEEAMSRAGFTPNPHSRQPGSWINQAGIEVDLMVPEAMAGGGGRQARGARIPPHSKKAARRARGLEAALVDNRPTTVAALDPGDPRTYRVKVAGPGALLVAKLHKIAERVDDPNPDRLQDKDAHDVYRLLTAYETADLVATLHQLRHDDISAEVTVQAIEQLATLFAAGPDAIGSTMAGRAELGIGEPAIVAASVAALADDLVQALRRSAS